jgi:hypothetical protein
MPDKFHTTKHAEPYVLRELELALNPSLTLAAELPHVGVVVEFSYRPGAPARGLFGPMEMAEEAIPAELDLIAVKLSDPTSFYTDGFALTACVMVDILPLLSAVQVEQITEAMHQRVQPN